MKKPKQSKTKNAGNSRKAPKSAPVARVAKTPPTRERDPRLPAVGTTIVRPYKGKDIRVKVLADGFEYEGKPYRSLTGIALVVTGYPACSGPAFFRLTGPAADAPNPTPTKPTKSKEKPAAPTSDATPPAPESAAPTS